VRAIGSDGDCGFGIADRSDFRLTIPSAFRVWKVGRAGRASQRAAARLSCMKMAGLAFSATQVELALRQTSRTRSRGPKDPGAILFEHHRDSGKQATPSLSTRPHGHVLQVQRPTFHLVCFTLLPGGILDPIKRQREPTAWSQNQLRLCFNQS
jgi:hypothetical protein